MRCTQVAAPVTCCNRCSIRLERILASKSLRKEIRRESEKCSSHRIETIEAGVARQPETQRCQRGVKPNVWRNGNCTARIRGDGNKRITGQDPGPDEKLPPYAAKCLSKERMSCLIKRPLPIGGDSGSIHVVINIPPGESRGHQIGVFFHVKLPADREPATAVIGHQPCHADDRSR